MTFSTPRTMKYPPGSRGHSINLDNSCETKQPISQTPNYKFIVPYCPATPKRIIVNFSRLPAALSQSERNSSFVTLSAFGRSEDCCEQRVDYLSKTSGVKFLLICDAKFILTFAPACFTMKLGYSTCNYAPLVYSTSTVIGAE